MSGLPSASPVSPIVKRRRKTQIVGCGQAKRCAYAAALVLLHLSFRRWCLSTTRRIYGCPESIGRREVLLGCAGAGAGRAQRMGRRTATGSFHRSRLERRPALDVRRARWAHELADAVDRESVARTGGRAEARVAFSTGGLAIDVRRLILKEC